MIDLCEEESEFDRSPPSFAGPVPETSRESDSFPNRVEFNLLFGTSHEHGGLIWGYVHDDREISQAMLIYAVLVHQIVWVSGPVQQQIHALQANLGFSRPIFLSFIKASASRYNVADAFEFSEYIRFEQFELFAFLWERVYYVVSHREHRVALLQHPKLVVWLVYDEERAAAETPFEGGQD